MYLFDLVFLTPSIPLSQSVILSFVMRVRGCKYLTECDQYDPLLINVTLFLHPRWIRATEKENQTPILETHLAQL